MFEYVQPLTGFGFPARGYTDATNSCSVKLWLGLCAIILPIES